MKKPHKTSAKKWLIVLCMACLTFVVYNVSQEGPLDKYNNPGEVVQVAAGNEQVQVQSEDSGVHQQSGDFYENYRLEREKVRSESLELLKSIIEDPQADAEAKKTARQEEIVMAKNMEQELLIETLLAAKNIPNAAAFIQDEKITVVIDEQVDDQMAGKIADIVDGITGIGYENVVIITREQ